jgi:hypothetical protein
MYNVYLWIKDLLTFRKHLSINIYAVRYRTLLPAFYQ